MIIPRSTVDDALIAILQPAYAWAKPVSKHWQTWSNTSAQPAAYLKRIQEPVSQAPRGENKYTLRYEVWVYAQVEISNENVDPYDTVINPILDAIDTALQPTPSSDWQNLGLPQVANCRINGTIDIADGSVDGQAMIVIPVEVFIGV